MDEIKLFKEKLKETLRLRAGSQSARSSGAFRRGDTHTHKTHACSNKSLNRKMIFQSMDGHSSCIDPFNLSISTSISIFEVADAGWDGNTDIRQVKLEYVENHRQSFL